MYGNNIGDMAWMDLSVPNAIEVKNFYQGLLGWKAQGVGMTLDNEKYEDFAMSASTASDKEQPRSENSPEPETPAASEFVTGICHAKGANIDMPAAWLPYFLVADIDVAVTFVHNNNGSLATEIKNIGDDKFVVIKDPAGAMCALYQKI